jgi:hypothetical protein
MQPIFDGDGAVESDYQTLISDALGHAPVSISEERKTEQIIEYLIIPKESNAAPIRLVASRYEVVLMAGEGTRFELGPLPEARAEILRIISAIAAGRLSETTTLMGVRFELVLADGKRMRGRSIRPRGDAGSHRGRVRYAPY